MVDGENEWTLSILLFFDEESLPSHIRLGFMRYPARAFVHKPHECKTFGRVCGMEEYHMPDEVKCCNCGGEHAPKILKCPVRVKKTAVARARCVQRVSYLEEVRRVEGTSGGEENNSSRGTTTS